MKLLNVLKTIRAEVRKGSIKSRTRYGDRSTIVVKRTGICWSIDTLARQSKHNDENQGQIAARLRDEFQEMVRLWPKFSGDITYPIVRSDLVENLDGGKESYEIAQSKGTMWEGEYGELRLELLDFCIEQLETEL